MSYETINPAIQKYQERQYSLEPDMINGWKARVIQSKQIPLQFYYPITHNIVQSYTEGKFLDKLIYLGPRPPSNISAIQQYAVRNNNKKVKQSYVYNQDLYKFTYQYEKVKTQIKSDVRPFVGMNRDYKDDLELLTFDSDFECGNLDLVVQVGSNEYDLFMRVDTNTKGHFSWFFFKACSNKTQKVKFNICNFNKPHLLYSKGMKPYVFSRYGDKTWKQKGSNVVYSRNYKYHIQNTKPLYQLTFEIEFEKNELELWFAYSIPYSYSYLLIFLQNIKKVPASEQYLKIEMKYKSVSGLRIPVLTIGNPVESKKTIMITGRMHPGESQGSWMLHNFICFLCSQEASKIREQIVFKIIPMVNVDGVIVGNFRTNVKGSDVNRQYNFDKKAKQNTQSYCVRQIASQCSSTLLTYMDFHGHSTRKGVFIFGPEYSITEQQYYTSRLYPKILSLETEMFRYYSCIFKIADTKIYTARAAMFRNYKIPYVFTVEASSHSYINSENEEILFSQKLYKQMGVILYKKLQKVIPILIAFEAKKQFLKKIKNIQVKLQRRLGETLRKNSEQTSQQKTNTLVIRKKQGSPFRNKYKQRQISPKKGARGLNELIQMFPELGGIFQEIKSQKIISNIQDQDNSDCESEDQNYSKQELKSIFSNKKKKVYGKSLINIKREQIKDFKTVKQKERQKQKDRNKSHNKFNPFKLDSNPYINRKIAVDQGIIQRIKNTQQVEQFSSVRRLDLEGKELPSINNSPKQKYLKCLKNHKVNYRNKTLQREYQKPRPPIYEASPLSHRNLKQFKNSLKHQASSLQRQIVESGKGFNFPWVEPSTRLSKQATEPRQVLIKLGVPKMSNQITEICVRRDYIRRKNKANRSYQLANLSLDLYH